MTDRTVLVTGASGFLGGRLLAALRERQTPVIGATRSPTAPDHVRWEAFGPLRLAGVDVVVHTAAHRPRDYAAADEASKCLEVNAAGTAKLVQDAIDAGVRRFVYVSAGNVYRPVGRPAREDDPIWPSDRAPYYLGSKICGEFFAAAAGRRIEVVCLRPAAIYGPGMPPGMIPTFVRSLSEGRPIRLADEGRFRSDLIHVDDVVQALIAALDGPPGTYNVGSGHTTTARQIAEALCGLLRAPSSLLTFEPADRDAPPGFEPLDPSKARAALGLRARPLVDGLRSFVEPASAHAAGAG